MMCVLVAARCIANAVAQLRKIGSCPSKYILPCWCNCKGKGHHIVIRVWTYPVLYQVR